MKHSYKLTVQDVLDIRAHVASGSKPANVAKRKNVRHSVVLRIVARTLWAHVLPDGRVGTRRRSHGEKHHSAKLTFSKVYRIKQRLANGDSHPSIAKDYKVAANSIRAIDIGKTWKHVPRPDGFNQSRGR